MKTLDLGDMVKGDTALFTVTVSRTAPVVNLTLALTQIRFHLHKLDGTLFLEKTLDSGIEVLSATTAEITIAPADTDGLDQDTSLVCWLRVVEDDGRVTTLGKWSLSVTVEGD
jgi:hypothetical protein